MQTPTSTDDAVKLPPDDGTAAPVDPADPIATPNDTGNGDPPPDGK